MDIQHILEDAKAELLTEGMFAPLLLIEWDNGTVDRHRFETFPGEALANQKLLFAVGRSAGERSSDRQPRMLCFIVEMWMHSWTTGESEPECLPSENPDRKEALVMLSLTIEPEKTLSQRMTAHEIIRGGGTLDLLAHNMEDYETRSGLLISALAGICSARLSDVQLAHMVASIQRSNRDASSFLGNDQSAQ